MSPPSTELEETLLADGEEKTGPDTKPNTGPGTGPDTDVDPTKTSGAHPRTGATGPSLGSALTGVSAEQTIGPSPYETMRLEEIARTSVFLRMSIGVTLLVGASSFLIARDPIAHAVLLSGCAVAVVSSAWLAWVMRDPAGYTLGRSVAVGYACVLCAFAGVYFFGPYSPAPMVLPIGLFFFSLSQSFRATLSVYITCSVVLLAMYIGIGTGAMVDRGLIQLVTGDLDLIDHVAIVGTVEVLLLATYLFGRASRAATMRAVEEHDQTIRQLARRAALLQEARQELERALASGGMGRYTEQQLGSFRLGGVMGRGAMGEVYEATHVETGEPAAVKVLQIDMLHRTQAIRRFLREAEMAASIDVRHVVKVLEFGGAADSIPYIAMEKLDGVDLSDHLRQQGRLSVKDTARLAREVAVGLEAAREAGIVHRDLKPGNLFYARRPDGKHIWKILDFGISKSLDSSHGTLTKDDAIIGTPEYMAPEQATGRPVTHRTDVYALGAICYRAITGTPAFSGDTIVQVLFHVSARMPPRPSHTVPGLPPGIDDVLCLALAKDPDDRFETATELARSLTAALDGGTDPALRERVSRLESKSRWAEAVRAAV